MVIPCPISSCGTATVTTPSRPILSQAPNAHSPAPGRQRRAVIARPQPPRHQQAAADRGAGSRPRRLSVASSGGALAASSHVAELARRSPRMRPRLRRRPRPGGVPASLACAHRQARAGRGRGRRCSRLGRSRLHPAAPERDRSPRRNAGRRSRPCSRPCRSSARRPSRTARPRGCASISARSCGVETITAPAGLCFCSMVSCTSPVPGGRSTSSISVSPQCGVDQLAERAAAIGPRQAIALPGFDHVPHRQHRHAVSGSAPGSASRPRALRALRPSVASSVGWRGAVDVGIDQPDLAPGARQRDREVGGQRRLADPALARSDRDDHRPPGAGLSAIIATRTSSTPSARAEHFAAPRFPARRARRRRARRPSSTSVAAAVAQA